MKQVYVGTSGWQYAGWEGKSYPEGLSKKDWLSYYIKYFNTVEINSTFYHQAGKHVVERWVSMVQPDFTFSIKGSRYITHVKRLEEVEESLGVLFGSLNVINNRENVVLWQFPPNFKQDLSRLSEFLKMLPLGFYYAFEFRNDSWFTKEVYRLINSAQCSACMVIQDWKDWPIIDNPEGKFCYIRFHGKKQLYASGYTADELKSWSAKITSWSEKYRVYAYFNNDAAGHAVENALTLKQMLKL